MVRGSDPNDNAEDVDIMKGEACSGVASLSNNHGVNLLIRSAAHVTKCWTQPPLHYPHGSLHRQILCRAAPVLTNEPAGQSNLAKLKNCSDE